MKRFIALTLCLILALPISAFAEVRVEEDATYYSFMSTDKTADFFDIEGLVTTNYTMNQWFYSGGAGGSEQGSMTFSFDGSKSKTVDGVTYDLSGVPVKVEWLRLTYGYGSGWKDKQTYLVSEDKENWYPLDAIYKYDGVTYEGSVSRTNSSVDIAKKYGGADIPAATWISKEAYTLNVPECFTDDGGELRHTKFVRVAFELKNGNMAYAAPGVEYKIPFSSIRIKNENAVAPNTDKITVIFSDRVDEATVTADSFSVTAEDGTSAAVTDAVCAAAGKSAVLTLAEPAAKKTVYTVTMADTVLKADGEPFDRRTASFTTLGGMEEITFVDDMTGTTYFITKNTGRKNDPGNFIAKNLYVAKDGTASWIWNFDGTKSKTQDGVKYTFDGLIKYFAIDYYDHANFSFDNFGMYASKNGSDWTKLTTSRKGATSSEADPPKQSWVDYGTISASDIPQNTRYLKIEVNNIKSENFLFSSPTVTYVTGSGKTFVDSAELDHYNELTKLHIVTFADIDAEELTEDKFTLNGENPIETAAENGGRQLILTFDGVLDFDEEYYINIDGLLNLNGETVEGADFRTETMPPAVTASNRHESVSGGVFTTSASIGFNYKRGIKEMKISYITLCYKDDKITDRSVDTKTVRVGETADFSNNVTLDTAEGEYAVTFILRDSNGLYPLDKAVIYPAK